jgi:hypothetical protein
MYEEIGVGLMPADFGQPPAAETPYQQAEVRELLSWPVEIVPLSGVVDTASCFRALTLLLELGHNSGVHNKTLACCLCSRAQYPQRFCEDPDCNFACCGWCAHTALGFPISQLKYCAPISHSDHTRPMVPVVRDFYRPRPTFVFILASYCIDDVWNLVNTGIAASGCAPSGFGVHVFMRVFSTGEFTLRALPPPGPSDHTLLCFLLDSHEHPSFSLPLFFFFSLFFSFQSSTSLRPFSV